MTGIDEQALRAALGDLTDEELRRHRERLGQDDGYRAAFERLSRLRHELSSLPVPTLAPGLDTRVVAALRAREQPEVVAAEMGRQFWRLALPGLAAAAILLAFATRADSGSTETGQVTLAAWYPISTDPTANR